MKPACRLVLRSEGYFAEQAGLTRGELPSASLVRAGDIAGNLLDLASSSERSVS